MSMIGGVSPSSLLNPATGLPISPIRQYGIEVAFGSFAGMSRISALGSVADIDIATVPEDMWDGGGLYPFMTASTALEVLSSSVNDAAAGTGARTVTVAGLDINYVAVSQTVALNGIGVVALPTPLYRIQSVRISSAGSGFVNAGDITVRDAGAGTTRALIITGNGVSRSSFITVPAGFTLLVGPLVFSISRAAGSGFASFATVIKDPTGFYRLGIEFGVSTSSPYLHADPALGMPTIVVAEKNDFGLRCVDVSANNTRGNAGWQGIFRQNGLA